MEWSGDRYSTQNICFCASFIMRNMCSYRLTSSSVLLRDARSTFPNHLRASMFSRIVTIHTKHPVPNEYLLELNELILVHFSAYSNTTRNSLSFQISIKVESVQDRDGSVTKSSFFSYRRPGFNSQLPLGVSQPYWNSSSERSNASSSLYMASQAPSLYMGQIHILRYIHIK